MTIRTILTTQLFSYLPHPSVNHYQRGGVTLMFVLIMLLVVSIVGIASTRSTLMQEHMASNTNVRNTVFEAAEAALALGEMRAAAEKVEVWNTVNKCNDGLCPLLEGQDSGVPLWISNPNDFFIKQNNSFGGPDPKDPSKRGIPAFKINDAMSTSIDSRYIVENLGQTIFVCDADHIDITKTPDCPYRSAQRFFRIVGYAQLGSTEVLVQSMYLDPKPIREAAPVAEWKPEPTRVPKCENGDEYNVGTQTCCHPDGDTSKPKAMFPQPACPNYCDGKVYTADQECCADVNGDRRLILKKGTCPDYCGGVEYDRTKDRCCDGQVTPGNPGRQCPQTCGSVVYTPGPQHCCSNRITGEKEVRDAAVACEKYCGNDTIGWKEYGPNDNDCCNGQPYNSRNNKCCADAAGNKQIMTGSCPQFCNGQPYFPATGNLACCNNTTLYDKTKYECDNTWGGGGSPGWGGGGPGWGGIGGGTYDKTRYSRCGDGNFADKNAGQQCCYDPKTNRSVVTTGDCPEYCGSGSNAIVKGAGDNDCCGNKPFNNNQNGCCWNAAGTVQDIGPKVCPQYCPDGTIKEPGNECCTDLGGHYTGQQAARGTCTVYCDLPEKTHPNHNTPGVCCNDRAAENYAARGQCKYEGGGKPGT